MGRELRTLSIHFAKRVSTHGWRVLGKALEEAAKLEEFMVRDAFWGDTTVAALALGFKKLRRLRYFNLRRVESITRKSWGLLIQSLRGRVVLHGGEVHRFDVSVFVDGVEVCHDDRPDLSCEAALGRLKPCEAAAGSNCGCGVFTQLQCSRCGAKVCLQCAKKR